MTDLEISKALALAIGWTEDRIDSFGEPDPDVVIFGYGGDQLLTEVHCWNGDGWQVFDYRDPVIAFRVAERYDAFPRQVNRTLWHACGGFYSSAYADTPAKAIALAVISGAKKWTLLR